MNIQSLLKNHSQWKHFGIIVLLFVAMFWIFTAIIRGVNPTQSLLSVTFSPTDEVYAVGNDLLGQYAGSFSADKNHIALYFDADTQQWQMQNTSASGKKLLFIQPNGKEFLANQWQLQNGDTIIIGNHHLTVNINANKNTLSLTDKSTSATYDWDHFALSSSLEDNFADCPQNHWRGKLRRYITNWTYRPLNSNDNSFSLGGQVQCHNRLKLSGVAVNSAKIFRDDEGDYFLRPTHGQLVQLQHNQSLLAIPTVSVNPQNIVIAGKTRYRLAVDKNNYLTISPVGSKHFFPQFIKDSSDQPKAFIPYQPENKHIQMLWRANSDWQILPRLYKPSAKQIFFFVIGLLLFFGAALKVRKACLRYADPTPSILVSLLLYLLCFAIYFYIPMEHLATKTYLFLLMWLIVTLRLFFRYRKNAERVFNFWLILSLLSALGLMAQLQLAGGSLSGKWFVYANNHLKFFSVLILVLALILPAPKETLLNFIGHCYRHNASKIGFFERFLHIALPLMFFVVLGGFYFSILSPSDALVTLTITTMVGVLLFLVYQQIKKGKNQFSWGTLLVTGFVLAIFAQGVMGSEEGLFGVQPIELAKTLMIWLFSAILIRRYYSLTIDPQRFRGWKNSFSRFSYYLGSAAVVIILCTALVSYGVNDHSPFVIIGFLIGTYIWVYLTPINFRVKPITKIMRGFYLLAIPGVIYLLYSIYQNPQTVALLAEYTSQSDRFLVWLNPWSYPDSGRQLQLALTAVHGGGHNWLGVNTFGENGGVQLLPAVQDDFMLAFYLHKFGGIFGILLLIVQLLWLNLLFSYYQKGIYLARNRDYQSQRLILFISYCLFGFAGMQLVHWIISWSNTLGLLPIMGQPMTFLSAGNSHLLALVLPTTLFLWAMVKISEEENI